MNKKQLIDAVSIYANISKKEAKNVIDGVISIAIESLKNGEDVRLVGFGTFTKVKRKETTKYDPHTKQPIKIPAYNRTKFKAGKALKDAIN